MKTTRHYGIYDLRRNAGFVNVGTDHDTAAFAVASIRGWWQYEGKRLYPRASDLLITADGGGSNGYRLRLWKLELQRLADQTKPSIAVCHFPSGTSKWNKVEHRLFSFISSNWRGEPVRDYQTVVRLIAGTTTAKGLTVSCRLDRRSYTPGRKVTDQEMAAINLKPSRFHVSAHENGPACAHRKWATRLNDRGISFPRSRLRHKTLAVARQPKAIPLRQGRVT